MPDEPQGINLAPILPKEAQLRGSFRFDNEIDNAIQLLIDRPELETIITHEFSAADVTDALEMARNSAHSGKVIVSTWIHDR